MEIFSFLPAELQSKNAISSIHELESVILDRLRSNTTELINILYRIDIEEARVTAAFALTVDTLIASEIAKLIVARLHQKQEIRRKYGSI
ncbi:MAG: hypothetical protein ACKVOU_00100 [Cytophagales bacterium]